MVVVTMAALAAAAATGLLIPVVVVFSPRWRMTVTDATLALGFHPWLEGTGYRLNLPGRLEVVLDPFGGLPLLPMQKLLMMMMMVIILPATDHWPERLFRVKLPPSSKHFDPSRSPLPKVWAKVSATMATSRPSCRSRNICARLLSRRKNSIRRLKPTARRWDISNADRSSSQLWTSPSVRSNRQRSPGSMSRRRYRRPRSASPPSTPSGPTRSASSWRLTRRSSRESSRTFVSWSFGRRSLPALRMVQGNTSGLPKMPSSPK